MLLLHDGSFHIRKGMVVTDVVGWVPPLSVEWGSLGHKEPFDGTWNYVHGVFNEVGPFRLTKSPSKKSMVLKYRPSVWEDYVSGFNLFVDWLIDLSFYRGPNTSGLSTRGLKLWIRWLNAEPKGLQLSCLIGSPKIILILSQYWLTFPAGHA